MATFIQPKGLQIAQSVPALVGMGLGAISGANTSSQLGAFGEAIGTLVQGYIDNKNLIAEAQLQSDWQELDNKFQMDVLSNPTIMDTEEGRQYLLSSYNDLITKKRTMLDERRSALGDVRYTNNMSKFKQKTENEAYQLQVGINQQYLRNQMALAEKAELNHIDSLQFIMGVDDIDTYYNTLDSFGVLAQTYSLLGVDTEEKMIKTIDNIEGAYVTAVVNQESDYSKFQNPETGLVDYDTLEQSVRNAFGTLLSPERIESDAQKYIESTKYKVDKEIVKASIYNTRQAAMNNIFRKNNGYKEKQKQHIQNLVKVDNERIADLGRDVTARIRNKLGAEIQKGISVQNAYNMLDESSLYGNTFVYDLTNEIDIPSPHNLNEFLDGLEQNLYSNLRILATIDGEERKKQRQIDYNTALLKKFGIDNAGKETTDKIERKIEIYNNDPSNKENIKELGLAIKQATILEQSYKTGTDTNYQAQLGAYQGYSNFIDYDKLPKKSKARVEDLLSQYVPGQDKSKLDQTTVKEIIGFIHAMTQNDILYNNGITAITIGVQNNNLADIPKQAMHTMSVMSMDNYSTTDSNQRDIYYNKLYVEYPKLYLDYKNQVSSQSGRRNVSVGISDDNINNIVVGQGNVGNYNAQARYNSLQDKEKKVIDRNSYQYKGEKQSNGEVPQSNNSTNKNIDTRVLYNFNTNIIDKYQENRNIGNKKIKLKKQ